MGLDDRAFAAFLAEQQLAPTTIAAYTRHARSLDAEARSASRFVLGAHATAQKAARWLVRWGRIDPALRALCEARIAVESASGGKRQKPAISVPDEPWDALRDAIARETSLAARVLQVICASGLRIGDVLRVERGALATAARTGAPIALVAKGGRQRQLPWSSAGATLRAAWDALWQAWGSARPASDVRVPLAAAVCESGNPDPEAGGCAYKACARLLARLGAECGVPGRVHIHRLRRTVGVRIRRAGGSVNDVAAVLGNSPQTAATYVDEEMPDVVARVLDSIEKPR